MHFQSKTADGLSAYDIALLGGSRTSTLANHVITDFPSSITSNRPSVPIDYPDESDWRWYSLPIDPAPSVRSDCDDPMCFFESLFTLVVHGDVCS